MPPASGSKERFPAEEFGMKSAELGPMAKESKASRFGLEDDEDIPDSHDFSPDPQLSRVRSALQEALAIWCQGLGVWQA